MQPRTTACNISRLRWARSVRSTIYFRTLQLFSTWPIRITLFAFEWTRFILLFDRNIDCSVGLMMKLFTFNRVSVAFATVSAIIQRMVRTRSRLPYPLKIRLMLYTMHSVWPIGCKFRAPRTSRARVRSSLTGRAAWPRSVGVPLQQRTRAQHRPPFTVSAIYQFVVEYVQSKKQIDSSFRVLLGYRKPFDVRFYTNSADSATDTTGGIGFCLKFQQLPCTTG